jgi:hypothetical protein
MVVCAAFMGKSWEFKVTLSENWHVTYLSGMEIDVAAKSKTCKGELTSPTV